LSSKSEDTMRSGIALFLEPSEQVLATWIASTRGHQQAMAGGVAGMVGGGRAGRAAKEADAAGINLASPMAFVLTESRVVTVELGGGGKVKRLLNEFDLTDVGEMTVKRLGLGASVTLELAGVEVKLESRVGASREFADQLAEAKARSDGPELSA
jgi:hypothetical protein